MTSRRTRRSLMLAGAFASYVNPSVATETSSTAPDAPPPTLDAATDAEAGLGGEAALSRNVALYENGQYELCVIALKQLLEGNNAQKVLRPEQVNQAKIYLGACLIASGETDEADKVFANAIRNNPQMRAPDSLVFPQTVVDRFLRVREQLLADIRREERSRVQVAEQRAQQQDEKRKKELRIKEQLRAMARNESVVEKNKRWLASVPFGVGQFQNGDNTAGGFFLGLETVLVGTCVAAIVVDENLANRALEPGIDIRGLSASRADAHRVIVASSWALVGVMAGGIVHAHWRFVPERRHYRTRTLPAKLEESETAAVSGTDRRDTRSDAGVALTGVQLGSGIGIVGEF